MHSLPREEMPPVCTMAIRQAGRGGLMHLSFPIDVTFICLAYLNIVTDKVHSFIKTVFPNGNVFFNSKMYLTWLENGLRKK